MANEKISASPSADLPLDGTELVPIVQDGDNKHCTAQDIADLGGGGGGGVTSVNGDTGPAVTINAADVGADASGSAATAQSNAQTYADGKVAQTITNGVTTSAPSQDVVFDALAGKETAGAAAAALASAQTYADGKVAQTITNGVTTSAPSQDVVFDNLALKVAKAGDTMTGSLAFGGTFKNTGLAAGSTAGDSLRYEQVYLIPTTPSVVANAFTWDCGGLMAPEADVSLSASATMTMSNIKAGSSGIIRIAIGTASLVNLTFATTGGLTHKTQNTTFTVYPFPLGNSKEYYLTFYTKDGTTLEWIIGVPPQKVIQAACSDEITAINVGTSKIKFRMPYAMTLTEVRASLSTSQDTDGPYGGIFTVDINEGGTTILSTKLTIDNTERTSTTAATAAVISDASLADDAEITVDVDQIGDGTAKGLKITLIGV